VLTDSFKVLIDWYSAGKIKPHCQPLYCRLDSGKRSGGITFLGRGPKTPPRKRRARFIRAGQLSGAAPSVTLTATLAFLPSRRNTKQTRSEDQACQTQDLPTRQRQKSTSPRTGQAQQPIYSNGALARSRCVTLGLGQYSDDRHIAPEGEENLASLRQGQTQAPQQKHIRRRTSVVTKLPSPASKKKPKRHDKRPP